MAALRSFSFPEGTSDALHSLREAVHSSAYTTVMDYNFYFEPHVLPYVISFLSHFPFAMHVSPRETTMVPIHFNNPLTIPVPPGKTVAIFPIDITTEGAKVGGDAVAAGKYWEATQDVDVEPDFYAVIVLYPNP